MEITQELAKKIQNHIMSLLGKETSFVDPLSNKYLTSSIPEDINRKANLSSEVLSSGKSLEIQNNGESQIAIPLFKGGRKIGILLINNEERNGLDQAGLIKSFAELLVEQELGNNQIVKDSTDQFVAKIIYKKDFKDASYVSSEASILGHKLNLPRVAIFIKLCGFWENCLLNDDRFEGDRQKVIEYWKKEIKDAVNGFFTKSSDNIVAYLGEDEFLVFKDISNSSEEKVVEMVKKNFANIFSPLKSQNTKDIVIGISKSYSGVKGLVKSFNEAKLAAFLGEKIKGTNKSYFIDDLGILSIIGDGNQEKKLSFASELLGNLTNNELLKTLECFFDKNLNLTSTAKKLHIHRNTVIYRLDQISRIIGLDPRIFDDSVSIKIALLIKQLFSKQI